MKKNSPKKFELIVIGGGTAGLNIALKAASSNYKTALIEPNRFGGVCLNTGCIPTKAMLTASATLSGVKNAGEFGVNVQNISVDFSKLMKRVKDIVQEGQDHIKLSINNKNLTIFKEYGSFIGNKKIQVGEKIIEGEKIIISTGSKPYIPPIPGIQNVNYLVSGSQMEVKNEILNIKKIPQTMIILGGGYIGFEFATFFSELGTKVYVLEKTDKVLPTVDDEIKKIFLEDFSKKINIMTGINIIEIKENNGIKTVYYTDSSGNKKTLSGDELFVSTGRKPSTFGLHLEKSNIKQDEHGGIIINESMETTCKGVYAVGDVIGKAMFAHTAKKGGKIAIMNALEKKKLKMNFNAIPWVVFTYPPIAGAGITEDKKDVEVMRANFSRAGRSRIMGYTKGMLKVWYEKKTGKIVGTEMIGMGVDEIIHEFVSLITSGRTIHDLMDTIHVHPTLSEVVEALK